MSSALTVPGGATPMKQGLTHEDYHFRHSGTGKIQHTPPKDLRTLYDYLPTDDSPQAAQYKIPAKVSLEGAINTLKLMAAELGSKGLIADVAAQHAHWDRLWDSSDAMMTTWLNARWERSEPNAFGNTFPPSGMTWGETFACAPPHAPTEP